MDEKEVQLRLHEDAGDPIFAEYADQLRREGRHEEALHCCLAGLSANPTCHRGRLVLARLFYDWRYLSFAVRELEHLRSQLPSNTSITKLLAKLSPGGSSSAPSDALAPEPASASPNQPVAVAEGEFDLDALELVDEEEGQK